MRNDFEQSRAKLHAALKHSANWGVGTQPFKLVSVFRDGLSHHNALIQQADTLYVLKLLDENTPLEAIERTIKAQRLAHANGLSPGVLYDDPKARLFISEYIEQPTITQRGKEQPITKTLISAIASSLKALHSLKAPEYFGTLELSQFCERYVENAGEWANHAHRSMQKIVQRFDQLDKHAFCHNDLVAANMFLVDEKAIFIDWEYAHFNSPFFDLAAIVFYLDFNTEQQQQLLASYFTEPHTTTKVEQLNLAIAALLWGDILWHLHTYSEAALAGLRHKIEWLETKGFVKSI